MTLATFNSHSYPSKAAIRRAVDAARSCGWGTVELLPDGRIRLAAKGPTDYSDPTDFERLETLGLI